MRDTGNERARDTRDLRGFCLRSLLSLLTLLSFVSTASAQGLLRNRTGLNRPAGATPSPSADASVPAGGRAIEFADDTPVSMYLTVYGELVGKTVLVDPQVPKTAFGLHPQKDQKLTEEDKIEAIETVLEMNGVHLEPFGEKFVRALPRKSVRKEGIPLYLDEKVLEADVESGKVTDGKVISFMIRFKYIGEEDMEKVALKVLESFKSDQSGAPVVLSSGRRVLVTDTYLNVKRMLEIVSEIDVELPAEPLPEVECIQIVNASASDIVPIIEKIVADSLKEQEELQKKGGAGAANNASSQQQPAVARPLLGGLRRPNQPAPEAPAAALVVNASEAAHGIIKGRVTAIAEPKSNKIILITKAENMQLFKKIIEALDVKTTLDTNVRVYRLKYADAEDVSDMFNDLIGNSSSGKDSRSNQNQNAKSGSNANLTRNTQQGTKAPANKKTGEPSAGELNKENTVVLADKRINGLVVMSTKELFPTIEQIIERMDIKLSQVLIETVIIEVTLGDGLETGMDWVQKGRQHVDTQEQIKNDLGQNMFYMSRTMSGSDGSTSSSVLSELVPEGFSRSYQQDIGDITYTITESASDVAGMLTKGAVDRGGLMNNWKGATSVGLGGGANGGSQIFGIASGVATNVLGRSFSFIFDSDELGLSAILQASKTDSHSKYVASPIVMTLDNKEAVVEATSARQFLTGWQAVSSSYAGSGLPSPQYTAKDIGIKLKVTPKINPNGTVMLTVEEEYSQVSGTQKMLSPVGNSYQDRDIDVAVTRTMQSDVLLENNQTVVFGGLTQTLTSEAETGIPILKDIPLIGKWLFGSVKQNEDRVELLVFMTPYVLDDAQAAQVEALRRKKTMSDPRPWEDHGWSLSEIADPVSRQEQMRRMKDEWKKQDEERKTRIAIEREKVKRAQKLKEMSQEEREVWLKMHKAELEEEAQEALEEKMLDEKSQEELRKLAAEVRAQKLGAAEKAIKEAEAETASENERGKLDAEKKAKAEGEAAKGRE